jgi:UDP-N-acetyl-D-mannosaminuronic acid dehydrogenase
VSELRPRGLYRDGFGTHERRIALTAGSVPVAVYGLGKMGLPLAAVYADRTGNVTGVDIDETVVAAVERGDCPVEHEPGLPELVAEQVSRGALTATTGADRAAADAALHVLIVPTTLHDDLTPDLSALEAAVDAVSEGLAAGDVVLVESTVPPGTCRDVVAPALAERSGIDPDAFGVAFCPERTASGRALRDITGAYPKVVGGVDPESTRVAELVYDLVTDNDVVSVADATTAECVKLFEGLYRDVNIALANELARVRDDLGVDVIEAIDAANTLSLCDIHDPGAGVGGHCIPYYPHFLMSRTDAETPLLRTARDVNESMPQFVVGKVREGLVAEGHAPADATVAVLGVTYRPGVAETRATPARPVVSGLQSLGATVYAVDPVVDGTTVDVGAPFVPLSSLPDRAPDAVALVTAHEAFQGVEWDDLAPAVVVDGRDALDLDGTDHRVYTVGSG